MAKANPFHTGDIEYMYLSSDVRIGRKAELRRGNVCEVSRADTGQIVSLVFYRNAYEGNHRRTGHATILYTESCFGPLMKALVPVERSPNPSLYGPAINRNLRRQVLAMRIEDLGLSEDTAAWIVGMRDAGLLATDEAVEIFIAAMADVPEDMSTMQGLTEQVIMHWRAPSESYRPAGMTDTDYVKNIDEQCDDAREEEAQ